MAERVKDTNEMIRQMRPALRDGSYHFVHVADTELAARAMLMSIASFAEDEGLSLILPSAALSELGLIDDMPMRCITLQVHSALDGVGLTAAVATVLAENGIPCNMVAAYHHDHAFVPAESAEEAVALLESIAG
ncbi:ACT domain protein [Roseovarius albus]|uniref:ACT domain protein n=1 Tax=Roseovarius albus TaxID=1247867 RepID=A0A1X6Y5R4_9RHOB|nr:ACT domain-containing protein [Roseovarius albus]SLN11205.1 ACT domain protein [Roseovarius albus]